MKFSGNVDKWEEELMINFYCCSGLVLDVVAVCGEMTLFIRCTISYPKQPSCSAVCVPPGLRFWATAQGYTTHQQGSHPAALARPAPSPPAHRRF